MCVLKLFIADSVRWWRAEERHLIESRNRQNRAGSEPNLERWNLFWICCNIQKQTVEMTNVLLLCQSAAFPNDIK